MQRLKPILGYTAAALTLVAAVLTPFVLIGLFTRGVAATGVRIDPTYTGGEVRRSIDRGAYRVVVHQPVSPGAPLQRLEPFVQLTFAPAAALPPRVSEEIDLGDDQRPDLRVTFNVPRDPKAELRADIESLSDLVRPVRQAGRDSFSALIARVGDAILVRVPLKR